MREKIVQVRQKEKRKKDTENRNFSLYVQEVLSKLI